MPYPVQPDTPTLALAALPTITKIVNIKAQAITAGTAVDVYTPTTGKKFNILAYHLGVSAAGAIIFEDGSAGSSAEILRTAPMAINTGVVVPNGSLGAGVASGTANNHIYMDVTASATVNGWIAISEL